jgi:GNAT superfamily N-acetyltransferase
VEVTEKEMRENGFGPAAIFHFFVAEFEGEIAGIALYYFKYSTWKGKCIYLDDIVVTEKMRGKGIGGMLMNEVIQVARDAKVRRLEWQVLNWNQPAIRFYEKLNVKFDDEWINCKLTYDQLNEY